METKSPGLTDRVDLPRAAGCCAGQAAGCGCSFLGGWLLSLALSALLNSLLGPSQGGKILVSALVFLASLLTAAIVSFLIGRWLPVFRKKAG